MNSAGNLPQAIILGLSPTGLYAIRELGRAGINIAGISQGPQCGNASRYLQSSFIEPNPERRLNRLLTQFSGGVERPVLIPCSDQDVDFVINHASLLEPHFRFQKSYTDGLASQILTKSIFYEMCGKNGVAHPRTIECNRGNIGDLRKDIRFPCLVKPSLIHELKHVMAGKKVWIARDEPSFSKIAETLPEGDYALVIQEIIPGPESEITLYCAYFDGECKPQQPFTCRKLRQYPPGFGSASLVLSAELEETCSVSESFLKAVGYRGIAATEFKRDPRDGVLKIIEMNPRPSLWFSASTAAGKHITTAAYRDLTGLEPLPDLPQRQNIGWRYGLKDRYSAIFYKFNRGFVLPPPDVSAAAGAAIIVDAVADRDDPAPMISENRNFIRKFFRRMVPNSFASSFF